MGNKLRPLLFGLLNKREEIVSHGIFTRLGGVSKNCYSTLNLSYKCGDEPDSVKRNRAIVASHFNIPDSRLFFPDQCHTNNVRVISLENNKDLSSTDALITNTPGVAIGVLAADCIPLMLFDPINKVVAVAHAGWRGTVGNIAGNCISVMSEKWGTNVKDVLVGIGPGIQMRNYEVGEEVVKEIAQLPIEISSSLVLSGEENKYFVDLQKVNFQLLCSLGIKEKNIDLMDLCTFSHRDLFFSARRDGFETGRFGAVIMLN